MPKEHACVRGEEGGGGMGGSEKKNGAERGEEGGSLREGSHDVSIAQNE